MSPQATDAMALHYQTLASLTDAQRDAVGRERLAELSAQRNGKAKAEILAEIFERLVATP